MGRLHRAGILPQDLPEWAASDVPTLAQAIALSHAGVRPRTLAALRVRGVASLDDVRDLVRLGVTPEILDGYALFGVADLGRVRRLAAAKAWPRDLAAFASAGVMPDDAPRYTQAGVGGELCLALTSVGLTDAPTQATLLVTHPSDVGLSDWAHQMTEVGFSPDQLIPAARANVVVPVAARFIAHGARPAEVLDVAAELPGQDLTEYAETNIPLGVVPDLVHHEVSAVRAAEFLAAQLSDASTMRRLLDASVTGVLLGQYRTHGIVDPDECLTLHQAHVPPSLAGVYWRAGLRDAKSMVVFAQAGIVDYDEARTRVTTAQHRRAYLPRAQPSPRRR